MSSARPPSSYTSAVNLSNGHNYKNSPQLFKCSFSNLKKFHINLRITSKMENSVDNHSPKLPGIFPVSFNQEQISYRTDTASAVQCSSSWTKLAELSIIHFAVCFMISAIGARYMGSQQRFFWSVPVLQLICSCLQCYLNRPSKSQYKIFKYGKIIVDF